jgi:UDP-glucose 6-dehydrogenase
VKDYVRVATLRQQEMFVPKVAFVNQFFDIAQTLEVDFAELRKLWLADPRVGESHTLVTEERGFRGRCLPKDVAALAAALRPLGGAPLLEAVLAFNSAVCERADREKPLVATEPAAS